MSDKTITRAELARIIADNTGPDEIAPDLEFMATVVAAAGIPVIDDAPPEGVVKLAREIVERTDRECFNSGVMADASDYALATIMHARKAVESAQGVSHIVAGVERHLPGSVRRSDILRKLGGEG